MKVCCKSKSLPKKWRGLPGAGGAVYIGTVYALDSSKLGLKLLVFPTAKLLRSFWKQSIGSDLGTRCLGAVNSLGVKRVRFLPGGGERHTLEVDRRYFAVMGLVIGNLSLEVVAHESVHAAFAYVRRVRHRNLWHDIGRDNEEELYCYPAGRITEAVMRELRHERLVGF